MKTHLEKIKKYFDENKRIYISFVITGAVCAGVTLLIAPKTSLSNVLQFQVLTWNSKQTVEVFVEALGDPGNIIQDMTTGIIYASQGLSLIHISEPTRLGMISYAVFCL